ncbi:HalOD1 output domain-containing protein [Saliphagus sp. GCM10025334]
MDRNLDTAARDTSMDAHEFRLDDDRETTVSIAEAMATIRGCSSTDLRPLYHDVDPALLERVGSRSSRQSFHFVSNGFDVTVHGTGTVRIESLE